MISLGSLIFLLSLSFQSPQANGVYFNGESNPRQITGITIKAGSDEKLREVFAIKMAGVDHKTTFLTDTDTLLSVAIGQGVDINGYARTKESQHALVLGATIHREGIDRTKTIYSHGALFTSGAVRKDDFVEPIPDDGNVKIVRNRGRTIWLLDGRGDTWRPLPFSDQLYNESEAVRALLSVVDDLIDRVERLEEERTERDHRQERR